MVTVCTTCFNIKIYFCPQSEFVCFAWIMRIDSNYLPKHHQPTGLSNGRIVSSAVRTELEVLIA